MASSEASQDAPLLPSARDYQQEMLEQSLRRNVVVAMDTGSGKTLIAILRIKAFLEQDRKKVAWFLAPTVMLCEQQKDVIDEFLPVPVTLISGALEPNSWKDPMLWEKTLEHRVVVSTPQVLLDAMHHGYVSMGMHVGLIVFDEAHHVADKHPYNLIMRNFYFSLPPRANSWPPHSVIERPAILGLTASPTFGVDIERSFRIIEENMDSVILSPQLNLEGYLRHAHRPVFKHLLYTVPAWTKETPLPCRNLQALEDVVLTLNIEHDPYVQSLRSQLESLPSGEHRSRTDQKLSKAIRREDTYTHKGLRDFLRAATEICVDLGPWCADWYIERVIARAMKSAGPYRGAINAWQEKEKHYLWSILDRIRVVPVSHAPEDIRSGVNDKVVTLIECLQMEKAMTESANEAYSCLVFVTRRDSVIALAEVLQHHPETKALFNIGFLLGSSDSQYRKSFLDVTRELAKQSQGDTLRDFRIGEKNLIVSTSVAEEGIDIQACGTVIRWDVPQNMVSWAQSRGRARRKKSTFVLMFDQNTADYTQIHKWEQLEMEMAALYQAQENSLKKRRPDQETGDGAEDVIFRVETTGATLSLASVVPHLDHFCAVLPNGNHVPIYDDDPAEFPEGWHVLSRREALYPYQGPFGATVTLPRMLPAHLRRFTVGRDYSSKVSARQHVAYKAYMALYEAKLLNDHLLPLTSVLEPDMEEEVREMLKDVMKRDGTADVELQIDPWAPSDQELHEWRRSLLSVAGLPALYMLTRVELPFDSTFRLYPRDKDPLLARIQPMGGPEPDIDTLNSAKEWTRIMFWNVHGPHMSWDDTDFEYLFLPVDPSEDATLWASRRLWWRKTMEERGNFRQANALMAPTDLFGEAFSWPTDIDFVIEKKDTPTHRFLSWTTKKLSVEIEEELEAKATDRGVSVHYPIVHARALPRRANFLIPATEMVPILDQHLLPALTRVLLSPRHEVEHALLLPSIIRFMSMSMTRQSFIDAVFAGTPLSAVRPDLLLVALTAPVSQERDNYQRLETLGDCALKLIASVSLFSMHPFWHEGYLSRRKDHMVSNAQLAKHAVRLKLYQWIIRDRFVPRRWKPATQSNKSTGTVPVTVLREADSKNGGKKKKKKSQQQLSTKLLADVVESCIGAAMLTGGWDLAVECVKLFGLGASGWKTVPESVQIILERTENLPDFPSQTTDVEKIIGYTFKRKAYLVEAITHASSQSTFRTTSYERMEFLGDAVLDWIVTEKLYHAEGKNYSPGHMHLRKSAVVNTHFLAYISLRSSLSVDMSMPRLAEDGRTPVLHNQERAVHLFQCMLHSSTRVLDDQENTFARFNKLQAEMDAAINTGAAFPWALLTRLQAPKFFSDVVEALLGAIWLDSEGNFDVVTAILIHLGILPILDRIIDENVDVQHPVSRLALWASREYKKIQYVYEKDKGNITCAIIVHHHDKEKKQTGEPSVILRVKTPYKGRRAEDEARFHAAEVAVDSLKVKTIEAMIAEDLLLELDMEEEEEEEEEEGETEEEGEV